mmetsp:Transcript_8506/g.12889  ORF Transcript_8506/g.12889 Transcript_8506/m.12889 type:complete len:373 (-) Transcript_8506:33-1151(-)|eukprot:CAMPEP_0201519364 /NCGR_PEP_ID=MMETSP0161_2-20130828/9937_1 /ASSEMBLY_ACC=CAM_ASM_000251 /TAXON_ID=180227 /ORGANISM="Neoparamoeba aestuarina, Strain SoJaBio B1-5/56/2" /LENGTH=372 /DNA_ID=CAMNT_0047917379 /DNA_START=125 /DNA_END=1243 /DNA_ORIENTATION=+
MNREFCFLGLNCLYIFFARYFFDLSPLYSVLLFWPPILFYIVWSHSGYRWYDKSEARTSSLANRSSCPPGGEIVSLTRGECHYRYDGKENPGRLVVLVHGFVGCHLDYQLLCEYFVEKGKRRVLRFDNYGRGWSSLPHNIVAPSPELYSGQLADLLYKLGENEKIDLVGYSMGGPIAAFFTSAFPDKVNTLTLIAAAGLPKLEKTISPLKQTTFYILSHLPVVGMKISLRIASNFLQSSFLTPAKAGWQRGYDGSPQQFFHEYCAKRIKNEPALPYAAVETLSSFPWGTMSKVYERVKETNIPVHALWAEKDGTIPLWCSNELNDIFNWGNNENFCSVVIDKTGHMLVLEATEEVGEEIVAYWDKRREFFGN